MADAEICPNCGKKLRSTRSGSITQWMFSQDLCDCGLPVPSFKPLVEGERQQHEPRVCKTCGKLKDESRPGSMTQWIFSSDRCLCLAPAVPDNDTTDSATPFPGAQFKLDLDDETIERLESSSIDYHGLSPDSFPFDRYRIIRVTGRGSCGVVYEVWDCTLKKRVAIKTLHQSIWSNDDLIRFQKEARATSKINHPNILKILDFGAAPDGHPYMVMEFVNGTTLKQIIEKEGPLNYTRVLSLLIEVCRGLRHAHSQQLLHRDLKSSNIMVSNWNTDNPSAKVIDFGIASAFQTNTMGGAQFATVVGTPTYMSPDVPSGLPFDQRSDIYSLGCVFFEILDGNVPFQGESTMATLAMHAHAEIPQLSRQCPDSLEALVRRCLAKEPDDRYQSVREIEELLSEMMERINMRLRLERETASQAMPAVKQNDNFKLTVILVASLGVLVAVAFASYVFINSDPGSEKTANRSNATSIDDRPDDEFKGWIVGTNNSEESARLLRAGEVDTLTIEVEQSLSKKKLKLISKLPLVELFLDNDGADDAFCLQLANISTLRRLALRSSKLSNSGLAKLKPLKKLQELSLHDCFQITDAAIPIIIRNHPQLTYLDVGDTSITAEGIKLVKDLKHLDALRVGFLKLHDDDVERVISPLKITSLFIGGNPITDRSLEIMATMKDLRRVDLMGCYNVTESGTDLLAASRRDVRVTYPKLYDPKKPISDFLIQNNKPTAP